MLEYTLPFLKITNIGLCIPTIGYEKSQWLKITRVYFSLRLHVCRRSVEAPLIMPSPVIVCTPRPRLVGQLLPGAWLTLGQRESELCRSTCLLLKHRPGNDTFHSTHISLAMPEFHRAGKSDTAERGQGHQ